VVVELRFLQSVVAVLVVETSPHTVLVVAVLVVL
jgi:hypothetical protein